MAHTAYLAKDNQTIPDNLIETLEEIADVKFSAHAATLAEATSWLTILGGSWHVATVDLFFKKGSGLGTLAGCRNRGPYRKVMALTNYASPDIRRRVCDMGAEGKFGKTSELEARMLVAPSKPKTSAGKTFGPPKERPSRFMAGRHPHEDPEALVASQRLVKPFVDLFYTAPARTYKHSKQLR